MIYGSQHTDERSIAFGKQLIDTFKPKSLLLEDGPLQTKLISPQVGDGLFAPKAYELLTGLEGIQY